MFNNTNTTGGHSALGYEVRVAMIEYGWIGLICIGICIYEAWQKIQKIRNARSLGLLEPLNPVDIELPDMLEETPSAGSVFSVGAR